MIRFPIIRVKDKPTGRVHIVGSDIHDQLYIDENGAISYYNLQNGDGTSEGYEFVGIDYGYEDGIIEMMSFEDVAKGKFLEKEEQNNE